jgi:hypothetical protein
MRLKVLVHSCIALSLMLGMGSALAAPTTLAVDSSASAPAGVPLAGTVVGNFDGRPNPWRSPAAATSS